MPSRISVRAHSRPAGARPSASPAPSGTRRAAPTRPSRSRGSAIDRRAPPGSEMRLARGLTGTGGRTRPARAHLRRRAGTKRSFRDAFAVYCANGGDLPAAAEHLVDRDEARRRLGAVTGERVLGLLERIQHSLPLFIERDDLTGAGSRNLLAHPSQAERRPGDAGPDQLAARAADSETRRRERVTADAAGEGDFREPVRDRHAHHVRGFRRG